MQSSTRMLAQHMASAACCQGIARHLLAVNAHQPQASRCCAAAPTRALLNGDGGVFHGAMVHPGWGQGALHSTRRLSKWSRPGLGHLFQAPPPLGRSELVASLNSAKASIEDGSATCVRCRIPNISGIDAEALSDNLLGMGAQSVVVQEHRPPGSVEQPIFDEHPGSADAPSNLWDSCEVVAYFALEHDVAATLGLALAACGLTDYDPSALIVEPVANEQWVEQIKASYVPLRLSPMLCIVPEWSEPPDEPGVQNIMLQPGVAFGTGEHPTTRMCLLALETMSGPQGKLQGASVMDYGAGSGILALAALKLGASRAVGTDVDPLAVRSAQRNAELNGYDGETFRVLLCGHSPDDAEPVQQAAGATYGNPPQFDIVCANILRGPLYELAPRLLVYAGPGSVLVLSGLLEEQVPGVLEAYAPHVRDVEVRTDGPWACVTALRRGE